MIEIKAILDKEYDKITLYKKDKGVWKYTNELYDQYELNLFFYIFETDIQPGEEKIFKIESEDEIKV